MEDSRKKKRDSGIAVLRRIAAKNHGIITRKEASDNGVASWYLTSMVRSSQLERAERGIYLSRDSVSFDELYFLQQRNQKCIFSYQSALYLHGLTDRIPDREEVTVPQGYNAAHLGKDVIVHYANPDRYSIGIARCRTEMGNEVNAYDMERTICDLIRDRKHQDAEIFAKAIHRYLNKKEKNIWRLREYAQQFGISEKTEEILEIAGNHE